MNGAFDPLEDPDDLRNFFSEVNYRDPDAFRPHMHHWIELAAMPRGSHASPIRATPSLRNISQCAPKALATGHRGDVLALGLLEGAPRSTELTWIMLAQRAARALSGLHLHGGRLRHVGGRRPRDALDAARLLTRGRACVRE